MPIPSFCAEGAYLYLTDVAAWGRRKALASGHCLSAANHSQGFVMQWNGRKWRVVAGPGEVPADSELHAVTFVSGTEAWAVGQRRLSTYTFEPVLLHWDGSTWTTAPPPDAGTTPSLKSVAANGPADVWAVGVTDSSQPPFAGVLPIHWDGTQWTRKPAGDFGSRWGVDIAPRGQVWAVGTQPGDPVNDSLILKRRN